MNDLCHKNNLPGIAICTMAVLFFFLVNGSLLYAGTGPDLTLSDIFLVNDVFWRNVADNTTSLPNECHTETSLQIKKKNPWNSFFLGGVLGFGSGQYYSERKISGTIFLITDGICSISIAGGVDTVKNGDADTMGGALAQGIGGSIVIILGATGLIISHTIQAIWGPWSAHKYNKKLEQTSLSWQPFVAPTPHSAMVGLTYRF